LGAFFVLISHSFGILNKGLQQPGIWIAGNFIIPSEVGLYIFFTISGYLVTQSLEQSKTYLHYLWKRFLRIVPALVVVNIACILIGSLVGVLSFKEYFSNKETWTYLLRNCTLVVNQFTLPGVFTTLDDRSVNASLWTILIEVKFYLLLMVAGASNMLQRKWLPAILFVLFQIVRLSLSHYQVTLKGFEPTAYFNFGTYFYLGTLLYCFRKEIPLKWYVSLLLLLLAFFTRNTALHPLSMALFLAYFILFIGKSKSIISLKGRDFSYGLYLYAFPVQQVVLLYAGYDIPVWLHVFLSTLIALLFGIASWFIIEKPALKRKAIFYNP
jgi:peptidoglycan/LPS O-acetylase OafA/YrhL